MTATRVALADIEAWCREEWELPGRVGGVAAARALKKGGNLNSPILARISEWISLPETDSSDNPATIRNNFWKVNKRCRTSECA